MADKIEGIVLSVRKYNDRNSIVTLFTREYGRLSFISPAGNGKASNVRRARLQPLSVVASEIRYNPAKELQRLGSVSSPMVWQDIYSNPMKRGVALFISEFLSKLLNETAPDKSLYDFLVGALEFLDTMDKGLADFHIPFLVSLLSFSGIQPDISKYRPGYVFEFASGSFVPEYEAKPPVLSNEEGKMAAFVARINFSNMKCLRLTAANRRQILYGILNYYSYHFPGLGSLKSPEILREVFSSG